MKKCETCKGSGRISHAVRTIFGTIQQEAVCSSCRGSGQTPEKVCSVCKGQGTTTQNQSLKLKIPSGIDDGATIRLKNHGEAIAGGEKGDLYVHVRVKPHKRFTREGDLILSSEHVSMVDASLGAEIKVETVDGPITMKVRLALKAVQTLSSQGTA